MDASIGYGPWLGAEGSTVRVVRTDNRKPARLIRRFVLFIGRTVQSHPDKEEGPSNLYRPLTIR